VGRGTTFKVYLPRVDAPADVQAPRREAGTLAGTETVLLPRRRDAATARQGAVERLGYQVFGGGERRAQALRVAGGTQAPIFISSWLMS